MGQVFLKPGGQPQHLRGPVQGFLLSQQTLVLEESLMWGKIEKHGAYALRPWES